MVEYPIWIVSWAVPILPIKELETHITTYQVIRRRLDDKVTTLAVLQNENKALIKILTQINEEVLNIKD